MSIIILVVLLLLLPIHMLLTIRESWQVQHYMGLGLAILIGIGTIRLAYLGNWYALLYWIVCLRMLSLCSLAGRLENWQKKIENLLVFQPTPTPLQVIPAPSTEPPTFVTSVDSKHIAVMGEAPIPPLPSTSSSTSSPAFEETDPEEILIA